jgi:hypothetical protein
MIRLVHIYTVNKITGKMTVHKMTGKSTVDKMTADKMIVDKMNIY